MNANTSPKPLTPDTPLNADTLVMLTAKGAFARALREANVPRYQFRDVNGKVDLAAIFNYENEHQTL